MSDRFNSECFNSATTSLENSLLGISNCRPDSHVAQQSRRDKLRVQQSSSQGRHHTQDFSQHLVQVPRDTGGLNPDLVQVRNVRNCGDLLYDPTIFSSEMLNFSTTNTHSSLAHKHGMLHEESGPDRPGKPVGAEVSSFANSSYPNPSNSNPLVKAGDTHNPMIWKGFGSQQICDWIVNYVNGPAINACSTQSPSQTGGVLSGTVNENKSSAYAHYPKPGFSGYQDVQSSLTNPSSELSSKDCHKQYESMQCSSSFYQNTLHEVVAPSSNVQSQGSEMASLVQQNINRETSSWMDGANELVLLPVYENQANPSRLNSAGAWAAQRPLDGSNQWNSNLGFAENKIGGDLRTVASDSSSHQALSLSLSSHRYSELHAAQFGERFGSGISQSRTGISSGSQDFKSNNPGYLCSSFKSSIGNKGYYRDSMGGVVSLSTHERRSTGPLGPFTGYATILKNSKFLKPAQQLLDEFCSVTGPTLNKICEMSEKRLGDVSTSCDTGNAGNEVSVRGGNSGASTSFYGSTEASGEGGVGNGSYDQSHHPEFQQRKAKLLYMQEEVSRRYKQYQQQMQMVVSSFESVAGLSAATPYTSLALKTMSKHFRCLKIAISDQLKHITKILGEDMSSATTGTSSSKGDTMTPRLKFVDQYFRKQKLNGDSLGFLEPQQHVWRPQRGLPERSVAILRAWLFEHFLHPYQTGSSMLG
uniref:POX domain-containing protein n=1 Tax=Nelumbo nucifera TaxID=4432 RepID=A0A822Y2B0_NELNU|nr:TPA_asm: hypothetical protein HUJ06_028228 [Nelumbo nucifera]